jgi:hypothetical protein
MKLNIFCGYPVNSKYFCSFSKKFFSSRSLMRSATTRVYIELREARSSSKHKGFTFEAAFELREEWRQKKLSLPIAVG